MISLRRPRTSALLALGATMVLYGLFSGLDLLRGSLGFLAYDGRVDQLSGGETALLRVLAVAFGVALGAAGLTWPAPARQVRKLGRTLLDRFALWSPTSCLQALRRSAAECGTPYACILSLVFIAGIAVRVAHLQQPMHDDEAGAFLNWSSQPLYVSFTKYGSPGNHVLHSTVTALSRILLGDSEAAVRLPALLAGVGLLFAAYTLFAGMLGRWPALLALSFTAASNVCIEYSANARGYSLAALLGVWQTHAFLSALPTRAWRPWLVASVPAALGIFVLPTMVYLTAGLGAAACALWCMEHRRDPARLIRPVAFGALSLVMAAALYSPIVFVGGIGALTDNPFYTPLPVWAWVSKAVSVTFGTANMIGSGVMPVWLLVPLGVIGFASLRRVDRRWTVLWAALLVVPVMVSFAQKMVPFARVFTYLQPFVYALVALGIWEMLGGGLRRFASGRAWQATATLALCGGLALSAGAKIARADRSMAEPIEFPGAQAAARFVDRNFPPDMPVFLLDPCARPFVYYLNRIEGQLRPAASQVPGAPEALWVRYAGAPQNRLYRPRLNELCGRYRVGPVLHRLGQTEIVALTARPVASESHTETYSPFDPEGD